MKQFDLVQITWRDALAGKVVWENIAELEQELLYERDLMETIGYLIQVDKRYITVAQTLQRIPGGDLINAGGVFSIPVGFILKAVKLARNNKRKN